MKRLLPFLFMIIGFMSNAQHVQLGAYIPVDFPDKSVMPKMSTNGGFGLSLGYSPFFAAPVYFEFKSSWGSYSNRTLQQTYIFDNGSQTTTDVTYTSSLNNYLIGSKIMIGKDFRAVRGYFTPQIGVAKFKTRIVIADPQDEDDCQPLDKSTRQHDAGFVYGGELGLEISMDRIFKKIETENQHKIVISANYLAGFNHFEYVNVRYMQDEIHGTDVSHTTADINANFINVTTNQIHEHKIAELYHTPLRLIGFNVGYVFCF